MKYLMNDPVKNKACSHLRSESPNQYSITSRISTLDAGVKRSFQLFTFRKASRMRVKFKSMSIQITFVGNTRGMDETLKDG